MAEGSDKECGVNELTASSLPGEEKTDIINKDDTEFEDDENEDDIPLEKRKKIFSKELRCMMYGFGDDQNPYTESVDLLEDLVIEYITEMTKKAMEIGKSGRIIVEDIIFLIRKDPKKYSRVKELLLMSEELRKARKAFDEIKYATTK